MRALFCCGVALDSWVLPEQDRPEYAHCEQLAEDVANLLAPQSGAYYDVWLDGEKFFSAEMEARTLLPLLLLLPPNALAIQGHTHRLVGGLLPAGLVQACVLAW
jgi:hypothetical protein